MTGQTITCPSCRTAFKLDESLAAPLLAATKREFEAKLAAKDTQIAQRETALKSQQADLASKQAALDEQVAAKVNAARATIAAEEAQKARLLLGNDLTQKDKQLADMGEVLKARELKLAEAQQAQADLLKKQRELDDAKRELEVTVEKRVQDSLGAVRDKAKQEAEAGLMLKLTEKDTQLASMAQKIEELKRKSEQGSQQLQGEALELELESQLRARFPHDVIEPVAKGEFGGDVLQRVITPYGQPCGSILWESKRTKNWSDAWLPKLRGDQRAAKADMAVIVSNALPSGITSFGSVDGVWVVEMRCALPVVATLREWLIAVASARKSGEGQQTKMELVYQYLTGPRFRQRIEAIVERFRSMEDDLARERALMTKQWAKRDAQLQAMMDSTVGMYGDLQGIAGSALGEIESLEMPLLESGDNAIPV